VALFGAVARDRVGHGAGDRRSKLRSVAIADLGKSTTKCFVSSGDTEPKADREASSMQARTNARPIRLLAAGAVTPAVRGAEGKASACHPFTGIGLGSRQVSQVSSR
jgi:hypothetical protein